MTDWIINDPIAPLIPGQVLTGQYIKNLCDYYWANCGYVKYYFSSRGVAELAPYMAYDILPVEALTALGELLVARARRISERVYKYSAFKYYSTDFAKFDGVSFIAFAATQKLTNLVYMLLGMHYTCAFARLHGSNITYPVMYRVATPGTVAELIALGASFDPVRIRSAYELARTKPSRARSDQLWKNILGTEKCSLCGRLDVAQGHILCTDCLRTDDRLPHLTM